MSEPMARYETGGKPPRGTEVRRMSRAEFDRLAADFAWRRGDYDARRGLAEVVAEPLVGHESRGRQAYDLLGALVGERVWPAGSLRIEWRGSVLEPDECFYFGDPRFAESEAPFGFGEDEACSPERGHAPPRLVVEINRSSRPARAAEKRGDYFEMGVEEVWAWTPKGGARIYRRGSGATTEAACEESAVVPGVTRADLDWMWAAPRWSDRRRRREETARRIAARAATD